MRAHKVTLSLFQNDSFYRLGVKCSTQYSPDDTSSFSWDYSPFILDCYTTIALPSLSIYSAQVIHILPTFYISHPKAHLELKIRPDPSVISIRRSFTGFPCRFLLLIIFQPPQYYYDPSPPLQ